MYFGQNIKLLRKRKRETQDEVAQALGMKRSTLSGYENRIAEPGIEALLAFSNYFGVAVDTLLRIELSSLLESQLSQLEKGYDVYIKGTDLRVLATTVDKENRDNIELVNQKARAGYKNGFADPEYIRILPAFQLPFLSKQKKYRTFQISGDSMLPIPDKAFVTGEYVENWNYIKDGQAFIVLTLEEGIVFKILENRIKEKGMLVMHSLNPLYDPYQLDIREVKEVWKFVHYISPKLPDPMNEEGQLNREVAMIKKEIKAIQMKLNL